MPDIDWRAAHHWLRGWSDRVAGKPCQPQAEQYAEAYKRGYTSPGHDKDKG